MNKDGGPKYRCVVIIALGRELSPSNFKGEGSNQKITATPNISLCKKKRVRGPTKKPAKYRCVGRIALGSEILNL